MGTRDSFLHRRILRVMRRYEPLHSPRRLALLGEDVHAALAGHPPLIHQPSARQRVIDAHRCDPACQVLLLVRMDLRQGEMQHRGDRTVATRFGAIADALRVCWRTRGSGRSVRLLPAVDDAAAAFFNRLLPLALASPIWASARMAASRVEASPCTACPMMRSTCPAAGRRPRTASAALRISVWGQSMGLAARSAIPARTPGSMSSLRSGGHFARKRASRANSSGVASFSHGWSRHRPRASSPAPSRGSSVARFARMVSSVASAINCPKRCGECCRITVSR